MILVALGTQDKKFDRLLIHIDKLVKEKIIKDKVLVISACDTYSSENIDIIKPVSEDEFEQKVRKSDFMIVHGGVGTILTALSYGKKVIAVPRLKKHNEAANDHQIQLIKNFSEKGYLLDAINLDELGEKIKKIKQFKPNKYVYTYDKTVIKIDKEIIEIKNRKVIILFRLILFFLVLIFIMYLTLK